MTLKYKSLDVYFHMTNHYKKLQSVKSVVDTSSPVGYCERQSRPPSRAEQRREIDRNNGPLKIRNEKFKNSPNRKYATPRSNFVRSASVSARPQTRRRLIDMPSTEACPQRAKSSGPFVKEKANIPKLRLSRSNRSSRFNSPSDSSTPKSFNQNKSVLRETEAPIPAPRKPKRRRNAFKNWVVEHDYMEFMLRITEDIIQNNLYTGEEILQVLNSHIETNAERLSVPKMLQQVRILCHELNVPFDKILIGNSKIETEFMEPLESIQKSLICTCNSVVANNNKYDFGDCECTTKRSSPLQCVIHNGKFEIDDLLKITQDFSPSQNIIETYYFKNATDSANSEQTNESNDQESSANPHSLSFVPELSETSEHSEVTTIRTNQPQTSQPSHKCCASLKTTKTDKHPCNCNKSQQWQIENVQSQNNKTKIDNTVNSISKQVADNIFYIGCPCSNLNEPSSILKGPLDLVLCCTNVIPHVNKNHQGNQVSEDVFNGPSSFKQTDKTRTNQNEIFNALSGIKIYPLPVTQKHNFYNRTENGKDPDEEFVLSLGTAYMPKSVSCSGSGSLFENVCVVAPDVIEKCKLILLKNMEKRHDLPATERNEPCEVSDVNSSFIMEAPRVSTKNVPLKTNVSISTKGNKDNFSDKCCAQISSVGTMTTNKCFSKVVPDKTIKSSNNTCCKTTTGAMTSNNTNKNIFLIVPDDVQHDQIFVVRKSQFEQFDAQSITVEDEIQIIKDEQNISPISSMYSCMQSIRDAPSIQSAVLSNPLHKIKKNSNLKNISEFQLNTEGSQYMNMATSSNIIDSNMKNSTTVNKSSLKSYHTNSSNASGITFLSTGFKSDPEIYDENNCNSQILSKLNDYDLTPQRDNNSNNSHKRSISFSSDFKIFTEPLETNKDKLLLGNEYEIAKASSSVDYSQGMPESIKKFYPNTASQTGPSDFLSETKSMSEPSINSYHLEHATNSDHSVDNQINVDDKSESLSSKSQGEEVPTNNIPVMKQMTNLELDLMLDFEINSEEQGLKNISLSKESNIISETVDNQEINQTSSSTSILDELLVSYKSKRALEEQANICKMQNQKSVQIDMFPKSGEIITQNVDDENKSNNTKKSENEVVLVSALKSHLQRVSEENYEVTDSQLMLIFNKDNTNVSNISAIQENDYQGEINKLIEKSRGNSDIDDSFNLQNKVNRGLLKKSERISQDKAENKNLSDDDDDDYTNAQEQDTESASFSKSSKIHMTDSNVVENDQQATAELEKSSLKGLENKPSTHSSQRRVFIKEEIVERKESFMPHSSSRHDSVPIQIPFIQIEPSDIKINTINKKRTSSNETQTWCCGLKSSKSKMRRDVIDVDKSLQTIPNISSIPDDQLFEVEMRRQTVAGYGAERKSLRFDYSMMSELTDMAGAEGEKLENTNAENIPIDNSKSRRSETSSLVIDIYKPVHDHSCESFMMTSTYLKDKNNENPGTNDS